MWDKCIVTTAGTQAGLFYEVTTRRLAVAVNKQRSLCPSPHSQSSHLSNIPFNDCGLINIQCVGSFALPVSTTCCPLNQGKKKNMSIPIGVGGSEVHCLCVCVCVDVRKVHITCFCLLATTKPFTFYSMFYSTRFV